MNKQRKELSADGLHELVRKSFHKIEDIRAKNQAIPLEDILMSGFALFSLKYPSLLAFDEDRRNPNLKTIYGINRVPSDTQMRETLDNVDPLVLRPIFKDLFRALQRGKALEKFVFMDGSYLLSLDGTGYYSSGSVHCNSCLEKKSKTGVVTYSHQMLGAAIVHPDLREVIPLAPEPIIKQDGETKNDCERNAAKRFLTSLRSDHPNLRLIVIEDGLSSNAPHIRDLQSHKVHYILGAKEGDHTFLFDHIEVAHQKGLTTTFETQDIESGIVHKFRILNNVPLNESNQDLSVNVLEYWEVNGSKVTHFAWVTDFVVTEDNAFKIMRGGRARWKIENETFNTLKNQGYNLEHNFGHGYKNLSVVFAVLMMTAFFVDQVQQISCQLFQAAWNSCRTKIRLWSKMRGRFDNRIFDSMQSLYLSVLSGFEKNSRYLTDSS